MSFFSAVGTTSHINVWLQWPEQDPTRTEKQNLPLHICYNNSYFWNAGKTETQNCCYWAPQVSHFRALFKIIGPNGSAGRITGAVSWRCTLTGSTWALHCGLSPPRPRPFTLGTTASLADSEKPPTCECAETFLLHPWRSRTSPTFLRPRCRKLWWKTESCEFKVSCRSLTLLNYPSACAPAQGSNQALLDVTFLAAFANLIFLHIYDDRSTAIKKVFWICKVWRENDFLS